jgi:hypothetical protein
MQRRFRFLLLVVAVVVASAEPTLLRVGGLAVAAEVALGGFLARSTHPILARLKPLQLALPALVAFRVLRPRVALLLARAKEAALAPLAQKRMAAVVVAALLAFL